MHSRLHDTILAPSRFANTAGGIDIKGLCQIFGIDQATLSRATGASRQTVSNYFGERRFIHLRNEEQREFFGQLERLYSMLSVLTDAERRRAEIREWFHSPNKSLRMRRPVDVVEEGRIDLLVRKVRDILEAAQGA